MDAKETSERGSDTPFQNRHSPPPDEPAGSPSRDTEASRHASERAPLARSLRKVGALAKGLPHRRQTPPRDVRLGRGHERRPTGHAGHL